MQQIESSSCRVVAIKLRDTHIHAPIRIVHASADYLFIMYKYTSNRGLISG